MNAPEPLRVGVIGVSGFGNAHYKDLMREAEAGRWRPVAATVINPDEEAEKCACLQEHGCHIYDDYEVMLREHAGALDLCLIPTGIALHAPMTIAAVEAGAHVFVEKPVAATVQEADAMREAADRNDRVVAVGYQDMYDPGLRILKQRIVGGRIGRIQRVSCWGVWPRPDEYYARNNWAGRLRAGETWILDSPYNNALAHYVMLSLFLAGAELEARARPAAIEAELYRCRDTIESPDTASLRIATEEGPAVAIAVTHCSGENAGPEITVRGDAGVARWTFGKAVVEPVGAPPEEIALLERPPLRAVMAQAVTDRIRGGDAFVCSPDLAKGQTLVANGAHEATAVRPVGAEHTERTENGGKQYTILAGVDDAARRAAAEAKTFSELGLPWASPPGRFDLRDYAGFAGGRVAAGDDRS